MLNRVVLVGRLTRDPELRQSTTSNMFVATFTVAFDEYRGRAENRERKSCFVNCTVFGQTAENLSKFTKKGSLVGVDGHLTMRSYETRDNRKVNSIEIICDSLQFLDRKSDDANMNQNTTQNTARSGDVIEPETSNIEGIDIAEDDLPF